MRQRITLGTAVKASLGKPRATAVLARQASVEMPDTSSSSGGRDGNQVELTTRVVWEREYPGLCGVQRALPLGAASVPTSVRESEVRLADGAALPRTG